MKKIILLTTIVLCCLQLCYSQASKLDSSFGINGIVTTDIGERFNYGSLPATQILPHADGSMYVVQGSLTKRRANGSFDSTFGLNGFSANAGFFVNNAAIQSDGKIIPGKYQKVIQFNFMNLPVATKQGELFA